MTVGLLVLKSYHPKGAPELIAHVGLILSFGGEIDRWVLPDRRWWGLGLVAILGLWVFFRSLFHVRILIPSRISIMGSLIGAFVRGL